jgi:predicted  nucleic acid-binding Zn-ribbon protein
MHPDLEKLLDLQGKDLTLLDVDHRLKALAYRVTELDEAMTRGRSEVDVARRRIEEATKRREELEKIIDAQRAMQERRRSRIEQVRTAREVQALMTEMDLARSVLARQEGDWLKQAEAVQQHEQAAAAAEERMVALEADQTTERQRLDEEGAALATERKEAQAAREASAGAVDRSLRARYDRLWTSRATAVVVPLRGDACGACFTSVPRNRRTQIRAGVLIEGCEACGVLLYSAGDGG